MLGVDTADAPWANEAVADVTAAKGITQSPAQTVKQAEQIHVETKGKDRPDSIRSVKSALSTDQALAVLGYGRGIKKANR